MNQREKDQVEVRVEQDRRLNVDASIVRTMKSRGTLGHNDLITQVTKQLMQHFKPDPRLIKQRIGAVSTPHALASPNVIVADADTFFVLS